MNISLLSHLVPYGRSKLVEVELLLQQQEPSIRGGFYFHMPVKLVESQ